MLTLVYMFLHYWRVDLRTLNSIGFVLETNILWKKTRHFPSQWELDPTSTNRPALFSAVRTMSFFLKYPLWHVVETHGKCFVLMNFVGVHHQKPSLSSRWICFAKLLFFCWTFLYIINFLVSVARWLVSFAHRWWSAFNIKWSNLQTTRNRDSSGWPGLRGFISIRFFHSKGIQGCRFVPYTSLETSRHRWYRDGSKYWFPGFGFDNPGIDLAGCWWKSVIENPPEKGLYWEFA